MGSIVKSTGNMVVHRPVELAGVIGMYPKVSYRVPPIFPPVPPVPPGPDGAVGAGPLGGLGLFGPLGGFGLLGPLGGVFGGALRSLGFFGFFGRLGLSGFFLPGGVGPVGVVGRIVGVVGIVRKRVAGLQRALYPRCTQIRYSNAQRRHKCSH